MESSPAIYDPDWPRYPDTVLTFATTPPLEIDLRGIPSEKAVAQLAAAGLADSFVVLTAYDPRGQNFPPAENEKRKRELHRRLELAGYRFVEVDACSPDRGHCECSAAVVMPQEEAIALASELEQVAIFWFDGARFWILGALAETDPLMLPRSSG